MFKAYGPTRSGYCDVRPQCQCRSGPAFLQKKTSQENLTGYIFHYKQQLLGMIRLKIKLRPLARQSSSAVSLDYAARLL
jgi:hypothetical protein